MNKAYEFFLRNNAKLFLNILGSSNANKAIRDLCKTLLETNTESNKIEVAVLVAHLYEEGEFENLDDVINFLDIQEFRKEEFWIDFLNKKFNKEESKDA